MSNQELSEEFWNIFDMANIQAEQHPYWNSCQMELLHAVDQSCIPEEYENTIRSSYFHQMILINHEIYQILKKNK